MTGIIVVDDEPFVARNLQKTFQRAGYSPVDTEGNPKVAIEGIVSGSYGIVFSDTEMPGMKGYEMMDAVRAKGCTVPFVGTSARADLYRDAWLTRGAEFVEKGSSMKPYLEVASKVLGSQVG
ncbi:hypothetical protein A3K63_00125 [Candidatus Micrarchaeota archaeon RBG_16_49_10]|nr:MAG: hypothetical protein A3K63_00125 [Candidatus Micrarchaeota archaeon RBG_16_49_10]